MAYQLQETEVTCQDGRYVVNERLVRRVIESYYRAKANIQFGKAVEMDTAWYEPNIEMYQVDWEKARQWTQQQTTSKLYSTWMVSMPKMQPRIDELAQMQRDTAIHTADFRRKVRDLEKKSHKSREKMVNLWGAAASGAKVTRDLSTTTLMVGATVLSAGSAAALFSGGAATTLNFTAKLQDSKGRWQDNIGAATVQAVGDLIFTVIPATKAGAVMRGVEGAQKGAIIFIQAGWDSSVSLLEGKEVSEAVLDGSLSLVMSGVNEIPGIEKARKEIGSKLSQWMLPVMIRGTGSKSAGMQAAKTFARSAIAYGQSQLQSTASSHLHSRLTGSASGAISQNILKKNTNRNGLDNAAIVDQGLVSRAVRKVH